MYTAMRNYIYPNLEKQKGEGEIKTSLYLAFDFVSFELPGHLYPRGKLLAHLAVQLCTLSNNQLHGPAPTSRIALSLSTYLKIISGGK